MTFSILIVFDLKYDVIVYKFHHHDSQHYLLHVELIVSNNVL